MCWMGWRSSSIGFGVALVLLSACTFGYDPDAWDHDPPGGEDPPVEDDDPPDPVDDTSAEPLDTGDSELPERPNHPPVIDSVQITPDALYADSEATCEVTAVDVDGDDLDLSVTWINVATGWTIGREQTIQLDPSDILPGETLLCEAQVTDPDGESDGGAALSDVFCGFASIDSLEDFDIEVTMMVRPWVTEDLEPGFGGQPWDWDGDIPDEVFDLAEAISTALDLVTTVYPQPDLVSYAEALDVIIALGLLIDEHAPVLLAATVPPDPDLFPYVVDYSGEIYPYFSGSEGLRWDDTYEIALTGQHQDLFNYDYLCFDLEDVDLLLDDNMGDWIDQGSYPVMLSWEVFYEGAYCTTSYFNPTDQPQASDVSYMPSSVLWMQIEVQ